MINKILKFLGLANSKEQFDLIQSNKQEEILNDISILTNLSENKKKFKEWIHSYLEHSENITEVKYKLLFISPFVNEKLYVDNLLHSSDNLIDDINQQLIDKNETKFNIKNIFPNSPEQLNNSGTHSFSHSSVYQTMINQINHLNSNGYQHLILNEFINEDKNNKEKINIGKKVYNDFFNIGILGYAITHDWHLTEFLADLQNFRLNENDLKQIEESSTEIKYNIANFRNLSFKAYLKEDIINKIIINENDIKKLNLLKDFYVMAHIIDIELNNSEAITNIQTAIKTKIEYLEISSEIKQEQPAQKIKSQKPKI